jgi:hypothetical protein
MLFVSLTLSTKQYSNAPDMYDMYLQGSTVELTFVKYNFTYTTQFTALGLQGEASYWFAGTIQTMVAPPCPLQVVLQSGM